MGIEFKKMKKEIRDLYETMWGDGFDCDWFEGIIDKTYDMNHKKKSDNSYSFVGHGCKAKVLARIFDIENMELFCTKYDMATSGAGNEGTRILTLHSSSLCALLHFYNVTEENPLTLTLPTIKNEVVKNRIVEFTQSVFEYKSPVINAPSNMDIVLIGKDKDDGETIVFFLESKFSEYYTGACKKSDGIKVKYLENPYSSALYDEKVLGLLGLHISNIGEKNFYLETDEEPFYIGGIKQMISHYTGIRNVLSGEGFNDWDTDERQRVVDEALNNGAVAILGEIIFDDRIGKLSQCKQLYSSKYTELAKQMSCLVDEKGRLEIMSHELGYSEFKQNEHHIEDRIKVFYREKDGIE